MGSTNLFPLLTNTASTALTAWLCADIKPPLPQQVAQGWQHFDQGDINAAMACFQDILAYAKAIGDAYFTHIADNSLQFIEQALSDWDDWEADSSPGIALEPLEQAQPGYERLAAAEAALQNHHSDEALKHLDQALHQFTTQGDITGVGQSLTAIASVYLTSKDYGRALTYGQAAIAVLEDCETPCHLAQALHTLGMAHFHLGHLDVAQTQLEKAATLYHQLAKTLAEGETLSILGQVYAQQKAFMFALAAYEAALDCCLEQTATATQALTADVLNHTGELYEAMGYNEFAIAPYQDALRTYQQTGDASKAQRLLRRLGRLYETQGRYTTALDCYRQLQQNVNVSSPDE